MHDVQFNKRNVCYKLFNLLLFLSIMTWTNRRLTDIFNLPGMLFKSITMDHLYFFVRNFIIYKVILHFTIKPQRIY